MPVRSYVLASIVGGLAAVFVLAVIANIPCPEVNPPVWSATYLSNRLASASGDVERQWLSYGIGLITLGYVAQHLQLLAVGAGLGCLFNSFYASKYKHLRLLSDTMFWIGVFCVFTFARGFIHSLASSRVQGLTKAVLDGADCVYALWLDSLGLPIALCCFFLAWLIDRWRGGESVRQVFRRFFRVLLGVGTVYVIVSLCHVLFFSLSPSIPGGLDIL